MHTPHELRKGRHRVTLILRVPQVIFHNADFKTASLSVTFLTLTKGQVLVVSI